MSDNPNLTIIPKSGEVLPAVQKAPTASPQSKSQKYRSEIQAADQLLFDSLPSIIGKAIEKATEGKGNDKLLIYLIDRCLGRPTEHKEISATAEWKQKVRAEFDGLKDEDPNDLIREYQAATGLGA